MSDAARDETVAGDMLGDVGDGDVGDENVGDENVGDENVGGKDA